MGPKNVQKSTWSGRELGGYVRDAGGQHRAYYEGVAADVTEEGLTSRGGRNLRLPLRFGVRAEGPLRPPPLAFTLYRWGD